MQYAHPIDSSVRGKNRLGGYSNGGLTQSRYGSHLSIRSQLTLQSKEVKSDQSDSNEPNYLNASERWKILKSKAPQIGK